MKIGTDLQCRFFKRSNRTQREDKVMKLVSLQKRPFRVKIKF